MEIRPATAEDHAGIIVLEAEIQTQHHEGAPFLFPPEGVISREAYLELLKLPNQKIVVAVDEGEIVGYLHYELINRPASYFTLPEKRLHVHILTVKATHRGRKIGEALMERANEIAGAFGASRITLEVYTFNEGAVRFYERVGFEKFKFLMSQPVREDKSQ